MLAIQPAYRTIFALTFIAVTIVLPLANGSYQENVIGRFGGDNCYTKEGTDAGCDGTDECKSNGESPSRPRFVCRKTCTRA